MSGTGFAAGATVKFGSASATGVTVASATSLTATAPAGTGTQDITVTDSAGTSAVTAADRFTYQSAVPNPPTVTAVSPSSGPSAGGTQVTVSGTGFAAGATVKFGSASATGVTVASATSLTATAPAGTGTQDITVTDTAGTSAVTAADRFTYQSVGPAQAIVETYSASSETYGNNSIAADPTGIGDLVILSMQLHTPSISISNVTGGNVGQWSRAVSYNNAGTDTLHYEVWWGISTGTGSSNVQVTYSASTANWPIELISTSYSTGSPATWASIASGGTSGPSSTLVTWPALRSSTGGSQIYWGASEEESTGTSTSTPGFSSERTANVNCFLFNGTLNPSTTYAPTCGEAPANVSTAVGVIFSASASIVSASPTVTAVSPSGGPSTGGTQVTVSGTGFAAGATVKFGSASATGVTVASATSLTATAPAGTGTQDITVTDTAGTSAVTAADQFVYSSGSGGSGSISAVGGLADSQGNGVKTLSVKPATTGDVLVLTTKISSASVTATSVSGGGTNTWTKAASFKDNASHELGIWFAPITSVGTSTITVTYSGSVTSTSIELTAQEFTTGQGASTSWSLDVASGQNNPTSAAVASPTLTSATSGELYVGYSRSPGQVLPGSTAGVTYDETTLGNILLYDTNVSGTITPTSTQSPADTSSTIGALLRAS